MIIRIKDACYHEQFGLDIDYIPGVFELDATCENKAERNDKGAKINLKYRGINITPKNWKEIKK